MRSYFTHTLNTIQYQMWMFPLWWFKRRLPMERKVHVKYFLVASSWILNSNSGSISKSLSHKINSIDEVMHTSNRQFYAALPWLIYGHRIHENIYSNAHLKKIYNPAERSIEINRKGCGIKSCELKQRVIFSVQTNWNQMIR